MKKLKNWSLNFEKLFYEQGEVYLEILQEISETVLVIEEDMQELEGLKVDLIMLDVDPGIKAILINKLADVSSSIEEINLLLGEGRVVEAHGSVDEVILHLGTFITGVESYWDKIGEDNAEVLLERAEEIAEDARDWKENLKDLIAELEEILVEFDEAIAEVQSIVSELEALGAALEVTIEQREKPLVTSTWITTTIAVGGVIVKEASSCIMALMLEKPAIAAWVGNFKKEIVKHFEIEMTLDKTVSMLIFPHTPGKLVLVEAEELLARIIKEGMRGEGGEATPRTMAHFIALVTVEHELFRILDGGLFPKAGLGLVFTPAYHKITYATDAPEMDEWRWWDGDFGWTHEIEIIPPAPPPPLALVIAPRLRIRAYDVDWGTGPRWEHNLVYVYYYLCVDGHRHSRYEYNRDRIYHPIGTMTGTPPGVEGRRWNNEWSVSEFDIPLHLVEDRHVNIWVNIDSNHTRRTWVVWIGWSKLEYIEVRIQPGEETIICPPTREAIRKWLQRENIGREDVGERPRIMVWRTVCSFIDGDDFRIKEPVVVGRHSLNVVRLKGVNAPELTWFLCALGINQRHHGERAKTALQDLIPRETKVRIAGYYPFRREGTRFSASVFVNGVDIVREMIYKGYAVMHPLGCEVGLVRFRELQSANQAAKGDQRGIWQPRSIWPLWGGLWEVPYKYLMVRAFLVWRGWHWHGRVLCYRTGEVRLTRAPYLPPIDPPFWVEQVPIQYRVFFHSQEDLRRSEWWRWRSD